MSDAQASPAERAGTVDLVADELVTARGSGEPLVGIVMGSDSDWQVMSDAAAALEALDVPYEVGVVSAHRMPQAMLSYGASAADRGLRVLVAGAGGAAHLPGMLASVTSLPVVGVPVPLKQLEGLDSLLSIVQMPAGVPVATVSVGGARNAGLLAARILGVADPALRVRLDGFRASLEDTARAKGTALRDRPTARDQTPAAATASSRSSAPGRAASWRLPLSVGQASAGQPSAL